VCALHVRVRVFWLYHWYNNYSGRIIRTTSKNQWANLTVQRILL